MPVSSSCNDWTIFIGTQIYMLTITVFSIEYETCGCKVRESSLLCESGSVCRKNGGTERWGRCGKVNLSVFQGQSKLNQEP